MEQAVKKLLDLGKTISTMESCTGGYIASKITNYNNASKVLKFSAVTYSNEFKIKMGVNPSVIEKYSVYSVETAHEMAKDISEFALSDYGIGVTGKLKRIDHSNVGLGNDNEVFISIYDRDKNKYYDKSIFVDLDTREENKEFVCKNVEEFLLEILN